MTPDNPETFVPIFTIKRPEQPEERFEFMQMTAVLGRIQSNAIVILGDSAISREHCKFEYDKVVGKVYLTDLGSSNGTFVNGAQIEGGPHELKPGDKIQVGASILKFTLDRSTLKVRIPPPVMPNAPMPVREGEEQLTSFDFKEYICTCGRCGNKIPITDVVSGDKVGCKKCRAIWIVPDRG